MQALLVEDDPAVRRMVARALAKFGWSPRACSSGGEAMDLFAAGRYGVAVLDIDLGSAPDGLALAERFKKLDEGLAIVLMSAESGQTVRVIAAGFSPPLIKPFPLAALARRVRGRGTRSL